MENISKNIKALILVGGFGTRLRPLTFNKPKPLIEFANLPMMEHQVKALVDAGVSEIVLAINYHPKSMHAFMEKCKQKYGVKMVCSLEKFPLGTAGPLRLAKEYLTTDNESGLFFVLNGDIICKFPLQKMVNFHNHHGKEGTICVTRVDNPSRYGVVLSDENHCIKDFIEKPSEFISDKINAGIYLFKTSIIDRIPLNVKTSIERKIFPVLAQEQQIYSFTLEGFWKDLGKPQDFIEGQGSLFDFMKNNNSDQLTTGDNIQGNVIISNSAKVHNNAIIGPNVSIGDNCVIGDGVRLKDCVILPGAVVNNYSFVSNSMIGWNSTIGKHCRLEGLCLLGEDVTIKDEVFLHETKVCPNKSIGDSYYEKGAVIL